MGNDDEKRERRINTLKLLETLLEIENANIRKDKCEDEQKSQGKENE